MKNKQTKKISTNLCEDFTLLRTENLLRVTADNLPLFPNLVRFRWSLYRLKAFRSISVASSSLCRIFWLRRLFQTPSTAILNTKWTVWAGKHTVSPASWSQYSKFSWWRNIMFSNKLSRWLASGLFNKFAASLDPGLAKIHSLRPRINDATTSVGERLTAWKPVRQFPVASRRIGSCTTVGETIELLNHIARSLTFSLGMSAVRSFVSGNWLLHFSSPQLVKNCKISAISGIDS